MERWTVLGVERLLLEGDLEKDGVEVRGAAEEGDIDRCWNEGVDERGVNEGVDDDRGVKDGVTDRC